jgi:glycosyltransferase involved in cell wall biosynthesis
MKRLLLIAYYYPPQPKAGALRPSYLAKHLEAFGWSPTVLTLAYPSDLPGDESVVRVADARPFRNGRRESAASASEPVRRSAVAASLRGWVKSVVFFPDDAVGWISPAIRRAKELLARDRYDAVMSTAPPPSVHFVARAIANTHGLPWLADYRDLWSGPAGPYFDREFGPVRRSISYAAERWLLRRANALSAPTEQHRLGLAEYFSRPDARLIQNAADMTIWNGIEDERPSDFRLCYTGKLYPKLRTPDVLFASIARLRDDGRPAGRNVTLDFYGEDPEMVAASAARFGLTGIVRIHGEVDRMAALRAQRRSAALLLLLNTAGDTDRIEMSNPGSKIYEYAGARRPIIAFGAPGNDLEKSIVENGLGYFASDVQTGIVAIEAAFDAFLRGSIEPKLSADWRPPTPQDLAEKFSTLLDEMARAYPGRVAAP